MTIDIDAVQTAAFPIEARVEIHDLAASLIREVANVGMGRSDILPFWFGESDRPTPRFIRQAAIDSLDAGETFYSHNLGRSYLRAAISAYLSRLHGRTIPEARIAATGSGVSGLMLTMQTLLSAGDRVVAVTPIWPNIVEIPKILGASVERVALTIGNDGWTLDTDRLLRALTPGTRLLLLNSPNNPTGWTIEPESRDRILDHCRRLGIWILADDVYERLVHDPSLPSAPSFISRYQQGDRIVSVNSFSKAWSMTGWRIGWILAPEELMNDLGKVIEYNTSCIFDPVQRAAAVALRDGEDEVARLRRHLIDTRQLLVDALTAMPGVEAPNAGGGMYVFFRVAGESDTLSLTKRLASEFGLGLAPGGAFGPEGEGWVRWCHAVASERLVQGIDRFGDFMRHRRP